MSPWLDQHLEEFVRPVLGVIPDVKGTWIDVFKPTHIIALATVWKKATELAHGRVILLPGRDVFLFEVLARTIHDYPTIFRPDMSSSVTPWVKQEYTECYALDTGYKGSIPKALKMEHWALVRYDHYTSDPVWKNAVARPLRQVLPKALNQTYAGLSGNLEGCPKYWTRGEVYMDGTVRKVRQTLDLTKFAEAAALTIHVVRTAVKLKL